MEKYIAIISNVVDSQWLQTIKPHLCGLGKLIVVTEEIVRAKHGRLSTNVIIIDSSSVPNAAELVRYLVLQDQGTPKIVVTASPTWRRARDIFKAGAQDYLKQTDTERLLRICYKAVQEKDGIAE